MKWWFYGIGLALLPISYILLMSFTEQPVDWAVLGFMALIVLPIIIFRRKITSMEKQFNSMSEKEKMDVVKKAAIKVLQKSAGDG